MAALSGKTGGLFYRKAYIQAITLALVDGGVGDDTITDSGSGFVTAGFENGDIITISGATNAADNITVTLTAVLAGTLSFATGSFTAGEGAGALITVQEALPGTQVLGFHTWSIENAVDMLDVTAFEDVGIEKNVAGIRRWSATADHFFQTSQLTPESWLGSQLVVRFFTVYNASPNVTQVEFFEGKCFGSGISPTTDVQGVVDGAFTFTGTAKASISGTGIAFVDSGPDTITDTGNGFITAGFGAGDKIFVTGATNAGNNSDFTIASESAGTLTLVAGDSLTVEGAGQSITIGAEVRLTTRTAAWPT